MKVERLEREFNFNGVRLPDPNPELSVEQVRDAFVTVHPEILTAAVTGPEVIGSKLVYRFSRAIGTKG